MEVGVPAAAAAWLWFGEEVDHQDLVSALRPVFVPPSAVNGKEGGGGRDLYQATHQKLHETKSGVSCGSVCEHVRRGGLEEGGGGG